MMLDRKVWLVPVTGVFTLVVLFLTQGWPGVAMWAVAYGAGVIVGIFVGRRYRDRS